MIKARYLSPEAFYEKGNLGEALRYYKRYLNIFEELVDKEGIGVSLYEIGCVQIELGEFRCACKTLWEAEKLFVEIGNKVSLSNVYTSLAELSLKEEKLEDALSFAQKDLTLELAKSSYELGRLLNNVGSTGESEKYLACAREIFSRAGAQLWIKSLDELAGYEIRLPRAINKAYFTKEVWGIMSPRISQI